MCCHLPTQNSRILVRVVKLFVVYVMPTFTLIALYMTLLNRKLGEGLGTRLGKGRWVGVTYG